MITKTSIKPLILANNDRFEGYKTAAEQITEGDLKTVFTRLSEQSKNFAEELKNFAEKAGSPEKDETTFGGKVNKVWLEIKSALTGNDRKVILNSCERGEDSILSSYDDVINDTDGVSAESMQVIKKQRTELQKAHDEIKMLRDSTK